MKPGIRDARTSGRVDSAIPETIVSEGMENGVTERLSGRSFHFAPIKFEYRKNIF
jgi:hypothetical protein